LSNLDTIPAMAETELGLALTVLRIVRGWSQDELANASGVRSSSISDYERSKMIPGLKVLQRLLGAMGYPLWAIEHTQHFVDAVRAESSNAQPSNAWRAEAMGEEDLQPRSSVALRHEVEQVSADAGRVVSRLTRLLFVVMSSPPAGGPSPPAE